jgi:hypothetical protein
MVVGLSGQNGHFVQPPVRKVSKEGQENAIIQFPSMVVLVVKEMIMKLRIVLFKSTVLVRKLTLIRN